MLAKQNKTRKNFQFIYLHLKATNNRSFTIYNTVVDREYLHI